MSDESADKPLFLTKDDRFLYSGRVLVDHPNGEDFLWLYVRTDIDDGKTLRIESVLGPSRVMLTLTESQADALYRCLHNALRRLAGKDP